MNKLTVRGGILSYELITVKYKYNFDCYSVLSLFFRSPPHGRSLILYSSFLVILILYLLIIWAFTCLPVPSDTLSDFLWVVVAKAIPFRSLLNINAARKVVQCTQCGGSSFLLDISEFPSSLYLYDARPYHWSFLEGHLDCWNTYLSCIYHVRGDIPPRTTLPFLFCSLNPGSELFITMCSSLDYSCSRLRPKA